MRICVSGANAPSGYGTVYANISMALSAIPNVDVVCFPVGHENIAHGCWKEIGRLSHRIKEWETTDISLRVFHEFDQWQHPTNTRIAYPFWELKNLSPIAVKQLGTCDLVLAPSQWGLDSCLHSKVRSVVEVLNPGVNTNIFRPCPLARTSGMIEFIHIGKMEERKSTLQIARTFRKVLGDKQDARLQMFVANPWATASYMEPIKKENHGNVIIHTNGLLMSPSTVAGALQRSHVAIYASKAEGWGLPVLEALACGLRVVSTSVTGLADFVSDYNSYVVPTGDLVSANDGLFFHGDDKWHSISQDGLEQAIDGTYKAAKIHPDTVNTAGVNTAEELTWESTAANLLCLLKKYNLVRTPYAQLW